MDLSKYTKREKQAVVDYLNKVILVFNEKGWTKGESAIDKQGDAVSPTSKNATKFCLVGGLEHVLGRKSRNNVWNTVEVLEKMLKVNDILEWNDAKNRTKRQVVAACNKAIKLVSKDVTR